jgi:hypothetical protein
VSHPSLGLPPRDLHDGHPADADALRSGRAAVAARVLERAIAGDPTFRDRYTDHALRELLADLEALTEQLSVAVTSNDPTVLRTWADGVAPRYRKRGVPLDDVIRLAEGLRAAAPARVSPSAMAAVDAALDAAIAVFRWHRRIAGDARKRNPVIAFIYKGA